MDMLIWAGAAISLLGVGLLFYCIVATLKARKNAASDEELKQHLQRLGAYNLGALAVSSIGLMMVIMGIVLS